MSQPIRVLDVHHHYVAPGETELLSGHDRATDDLEAAANAEISHRRHVMASVGSTHAIIMPGHGYLRPDGVADTRRVNDRVAAYRAAHADIFPAALGVVEPQHGQAAFAELERIHDELQLSGITFHTRFQGVPTDSPAVLALIQYAANLGLAVFIHAGESSEEAVWRVLALARQVPDTTLVVLDGLTGLEQANESCLAAELASNLVFDTAGCPDFVFVRRLVDRVGWDRVAFGTNTYSALAGPPRKHVLPEIQALEPAAVQAITSTTISRVLGLGA